MKTLRTLLFISFCIITSVSVAQRIDTDIRYNTASTDDNIICYTPNNKLAIDDFKGMPVENSVAVAITSSGFSFKAGFRNTGSKATLIIVVSCNFDKNLSWMKAHGKNNYILRHEQYHFDITYLSTLTFIQKLKQADFTVDNYQDKLKEVYYAIMGDMQQLQHQYDAETQNGQLKQEQLAWGKKIDDRLVMVTAK
jgi:FtsZ-binding cell division protein ZapB